MVALKNVVKEIETISVVNSWLKDLSHNTKKSYLNALAEFCIANSLNPEEMLKIIYMEEEERLPAWERSVNKWFENFDEHCKKQNRTKKTRDNRRGIVNAFICFNELPAYVERGKRRKSNDFKEPNKRKALTKDNIRNLLDACKTWKMKAVILTQVSSGLSAADILKLKVKDIKTGIIEVHDKNAGKNRRICKLHLSRKKTNKEFITFISEEALGAIEKYLKLERINPDFDGALFPSSKSSNKPMKINTLQMAYISLNNYLGWENEEKGRFRKATSHMMRKFFNTQLVYAGMPEEIREHFMGHVLKSKVRDAYFLNNDEELQKVYLKYMHKVTIQPKESPVSMFEFNEVITNHEKLKKENKQLKIDLNEFRELIANYNVALDEPNKELKEENMQLGEALSGVMYDNQMQQSEIMELSQIVQEMKQEIKKIKNNA
ncbi:MAG: site-specific integrase [Methanobacterium sp.]|uniref:tyrosine-type recombinase/integrase n=1 Tax=Methanobacterium sp. TaxID=2164 RepID=UPI003D653F71|nr:site-specific integrase [Methanobacterium sp.]